MRSVLLEICCGSLDDAMQAEQGGADRIELCSSLFLGGLTPSFGTIAEAKARLKIPIMVMIRPRSGGFCYTELEMAAMERDTEMAVAQDADGIVFGILNPDGTVDLPRSRRILQRIGARQAVFHRAFDVTPDGFDALDQLVGLGVTRILTSGQRNSVPEGAAFIKRLIDYAGDRIEILPGGGIAPYNLQDMIERTGCRQVHLTALHTRYDLSTQQRPFVTFGGPLFPPENQYEVTDAGLVAEISQRLKK